VDWQDLPAVVGRMVADVGCVVAVSTYDVDADVFNVAVTGIVVVVAAADVNCSPRAQR